MIWKVVILLVRVTRQGYHCSGADGGLHVQMEGKSEGRFGLYAG